MFKVIGDNELLSKRVANEIEAAIETGKFVTGSKLPTEFELCEQFGVSRTSIREALRTLSAKGLISIEKGKGIYVSNLTSKHVTDPMHSYLKHHLGTDYVLEIIEARMIIEPEFARIAAVNHKEEDIKLLDDDLKILISYVGDPHEMAQLDMNFHIDIAKATRNNLMPLVLKPIFNLMPDIKEKIIADVPEAHDSASEWHQKIFDSIKERDSIKAYETMRQHLMIAKEHAKRMLTIEGLLVNGNS